MTVSYPNIKSGTALQVLTGDGATPTEAFTFLCIATTKSLKQDAQLDGAMVYDCNDQTAPAVRKSVVTGKTFDLSASGKADFARYRVLEGKLGVVANYQVKIAGTGAEGGGTYQGAFILKEISLSTSDNKLVEFSFSLEGQGTLTFTASA